MTVWQNKFNQAGDTIVEVLIATAVISSVLAGAFIVSQKSAVGVLDSQEHSEMLQILQGQAELLRANALTQKTESTGVYQQPPGATKYFCMDSSAARVVSLPIGTVALPPVANDDVSNYSTGCRFGSDRRYAVAISYNNPSATPAINNFELVGRWDRFGGGKNQEMIVYRVHPEGN